MITLVAQWKILSCFAVYNWKKNDFRNISMRGTVNSCSLIKRQNLIIANSSA